MKEDQALPLTVVRYRILTERAGWSGPLRVEILPMHYRGGVNGTAFAVIGRAHPGAIGIELISVRELT